MKKRVAVLGCGLVGSVIARDLAAQPDLSVAVHDASSDSLAALARDAAVETRRADLADPRAIAAAISGADAVVGALPGRLGHAMLATVVSAGVPIADISFSREDPLTLDGLARERDATAVVDCGVSPGFSNLVVGLAAAGLARVEEVEILVGGLPEDRMRPGGYAVVFSAADVIEEYTRPARIVEDGRVAVRPPLSEVEELEVSGVGRVEAFLTDGLRTLLSTVDAARMREKTLRYPGHAAAMKALSDAGFFSEDSVEVGDVSVAPRTLAIRLLARLWKLSPGEQELTFLRVSVTGADSVGSRTRRRFELLDRTDPRSGTTSMARTTGFPCAIMAAMLARGQYRAPGVRALEGLGSEPLVAAKLLDGLSTRGIRWTDETVTLR